MTSMLLPRGVCNLETVLAIDLILQLRSCLCFNLEGKLIMVFRKQGLPSDGAVTTIADTHCLEHCDL